MARIAVLTALLGAASAQKVCQDDAANFLPEHPFRTGFGLDGNRTCGNWRDDYFEMDLNTMEDCIAQVSFSLVGLEGQVKMTKFKLLDYIARDAGCCGESDEGRVSPCAQFKEMVPRAPCDGDSMVAEDGMCFPCYANIVEREGERKCQQCYSGDTSGCTVEECGSFGGIWDYNDGYCRVCNGMALWGCEEHSCATNGGNWDRWDEECRPCRIESGDVEGCDESTCTTNGLRWKTWQHCEDDVCEERGKCSRCAPEEGDFGGCDEAHCNIAGGANWDRWDQVCRGCNPESGELDGCGQEECEQGGGMYKTWEQDGEERGSCQRCAPWDMDLGGCNEDRCRDAMSTNDKIVWSCRHGECHCAKCTHDDYSVCPDREKCERVSRVWCNEDHCSDSCDSGCAWDRPHECHEEHLCTGVGRDWCGTHCSDSCDSGCAWDRPHECHEEHLCTGVGRAWCGTHCSESCDSGCAWDRPHECHEEHLCTGVGRPWCGTHCSDSCDSGRCTRVAQQAADAARSKGYSPRHC